MRRPHHTRHMTSPKKPAQPKQTNAWKHENCSPAVIRNMKWVYIPVHVYDIPGMSYIPCPRYSVRQRLLPTARALILDRTMGMVACPPTTIPWLARCVRRAVSPLPPPPTPLPLPSPLPPAPPPPLTMPVRSKSPDDLDAVRTKCLCLINQDNYDKVRPPPNESARVVPYCCVVMGLASSWG